VWNHIALIVVIGFILFLMFPEIVAGLVLLVGGVATFAGIAMVLYVAVNSTGPQRHVETASNTPPAGSCAERLEIRRRLVEKHGYGWVEPGSGWSWQECK